MNEKILAVDDEPRFLRLVEANLESEGYQILTAKNGKEALDVMINSHPDLVLMDVMMPEMDGLQALDRIREFSNTPVIMLTAKGEEADRIEGLNRGADDYIIKPFSAGEMLARVRAVLRRAQVAAAPDQPRSFNHGDLQIDFARAEVSVNNDPVMLSATEYRLLLQFVHNVGKVMTAEILLENVWGDEYREDKEILWVCISRLRQKLEHNPKRPEHIITRSGLGYTMPA
ncbi:MAG: response regulator transcription factor [Anaerolineae bacterium]|nr:response regulator transcription factor [Anaerolineae bacterium]